MPEEEEIDPAVDFASRIATPTSAGGTAIPLPLVATPTTARLQVIHKISSYHFLYKSVR